MNHVICAVYDSAVGAYMRPFSAPSRAAAQRSFVDEVNRSGSEMNAHSSDYVLFELASWDDVNGSFTSNVIEVIVRGKDVYREKLNV